jgi:hypothetical protein
LETLKNELEKAKTRLDKEMVSRTISSLWMPPLNLESLPLDNKFDSITMYRTTKKPSKRSTTSKQSWL